MIYLRGDGGGLAYRSTPHSDLIKCTAGSTYPKIWRQPATRDCGRFAARGSTSLTHNVMEMGGFRPGDQERRIFGLSEPINNGRPFA